MSTLKKIAAWFTPERRQLIQVFFGALAPIAIWLGFITESAAEQWLIITGATLQFAASLLSLINLRGILNIWTVLRGAIYTAGMAIAPALTLLGIIDQATGDQVLIGLSLGLSALSSLVAILAGKTQQLDALAASTTSNVKGE